MIELNTFKKILEENEERLPLLTLDEFFDGNTEEDSIAPNQWEFGRPTLSEIRNMLQKIELMPDIAWVRVALHDDTEIVENNGKEELVLAGDTIVICTTILPAELEKLVNCEWLCSAYGTKCPKPLDTVTICVATLIYFSGRSFLKIEMGGKPF